MVLESIELHLRLEIEQFEIVDKKCRSESDLKKRQFWVCGFDKDGNKNFTEHDWNGNNVLLFGSEGYGLKHQTLKNSDFLLKIKINRKVESLNISNSAAVVFHYINNLKG